MISKVGTGVNKDSFVHNVQFGRKRDGFDSSYPTYGTGLTAQDFMTKRLIVLSPEMDVFEGIEILIRNKVSGHRLLIRTAGFWVFFQKSPVSKS